MTVSSAILSGPIVNPANGHTYYLLTQNTWTASEAEAVSLRGHLATVNDAQENAWITATFSQGFYLWIGLNDVDVEGRFVWSSGQSVTYLNWFSGEPNNLNGGEDYVHIYNFDAGFRRWNDNSNISSISGFPFHGVVELEGRIPSIVNQPANQVVRTGENATFGVTATGDAPLTYEWQFNELPISGATSSSYTVIGVAQSNAGEYSVRVSNPYGVITSAGARLTLRPANDSFVERIRLAGTSVITNGSNVGASKEPGEPDHADNRGSMVVQVLSRGLHLLSRSMQATSSLLAAPVRSMSRSSMVRRLHLTLDAAYIDFGNRGVMIEAGCIDGSASVVTWTARAVAIDAGCIDCGGGGCFDR